MILPKTPDSSAGIFFSRYIGFEKIAPFSSEIFCSLDLHGNILEITGATKSMLGFEANELKDANWMDFIPKKQVSIIKSFFLLVMKEGSQQGLRCQLQFRDGSFKNVNWSAIWDDERNIFLAVLKPDSGARQDDRKIDQIRDHIKNSYHLTGTGWWEWDLQNNNYYASDEMYEIYGLNRDEYPSLTLDVFYNLIHHDDNVSFKKGMEEL